MVVAIGACDTAGLSLDGCQGGIQGSVDDLLGGWELTPTARVEPAVRARLTQGGFDLVATRIRDLFSLLFEQDEYGRILIPLDQFLTEPLTFPVLDIPELLEVDAKLWFQDVVLTLDWANLRVELVDDPAVPATIRIAIEGGRLGIAGGAIAGRANFTSGTGASADVDLACNIINQKGGEDGEPSYMAGADATILVTLDTDAEGNLQIGATLDDFTLEPPAFRTEPACDTAPECQDGNNQPCAECELVCILNFEEGNLDGLVESLQDQLRPAILGIANELVAGLLSSNLNGQPLHFGGRLPLADLLAGLAAELGEVFPAVRDIAFAVSPAPAAFAVVDGGLNVTLGGGVEAAETHPCATAMGPPPDFSAWTHGPPPAFEGTVAGPAGPLAYHVGAAVPGTLIDEAVWAAAEAGVLCVQIDSQTIRRLTGLTLTSGAIDVLLPGVRGLAGDRAPLLLTVEPHLTADSFPVTRLSPPGGSLMEVALPGAGISLYALVADRWVRLFEVDADLLVQASAVIEGTNLVSVTLDNLALDMVRETYDELLPTAELDRIVPVVVELAMALLVGQPLALDADLGPILADAIDLPLTASVEHLAADGPKKDWVALYLNLHPKDEGALTASVETRARLVAGGDAAVIEVDADGGGAEVEAQWRVDGTLWRPFSTARTLTVRHPLLALPGEHVVEVRARLVGAWRTLDDTPALLTVRTGVDGAIVAPVPEPPAPPAPPAPAADGCATGGSPAAGLALALAALAGLLAALRRAS